MATRKSSSSNGRKKTGSLWEDVTSLFSSSNGRKSKSANSRSSSTKAKRSGTMSRSEAASIAGSAPHSCRGRECSSNSRRSTKSKNSK